jgi:hypothetical protein
MIDRYQMFRQLMDLLADECEIVDADMHNWEGAVEVKAVCGGQEITLTAKFEEEKNDGN